MLLLQHISYTHTNKTVLFSNISLAVHAKDKIALTGKNGIGKSTLLKIIAGELPASSGNINIQEKPYYIPQNFGQHNHLTVGQALNVEGKVQALHAILSGDTSAEKFSELNDDWTIEDRCKAALQHWKLEGIDLTRKMEKLSGGEKTRLFLAGILIHQPEIILLDEPSNHLDTTSRQLLYDFIRSAKSTLIVVSHDRTLLNLLDTVCELSEQKITIYGGNYDFYAAQKQAEYIALRENIHDKEKALRKAKEKERESIERQQKLDSRGKRKQENAGIAKIMMNTLRNNAEQSTAKMKEVHGEKIDGITQQLKELRNHIPGASKMKFGFDHSGLHRGKILFEAKGINHSWNDQWLWSIDMDLLISSGERIALKGANGSGKTTLINIILGKIPAKTGHLHTAIQHAIYIDQDYSLLKNEYSIYEQAQLFNTGGLEEHEIKIRLSRFLFGKNDWNKPCAALSGGERMRLILCCLLVSKQSPDIIILDEPTNNLDIENIEILTNAINEYEGTLLIVSHDEYFLNDINIQRTIQL